MSFYTILCHFTQFYVILCNFYVILHNFTSRYISLCDIHSIILRHFTYFCHFYSFQIILILLSHFTSFCSFHYLLKVNFLIGFSNLSIKIKASFKRPDFQSKFELRFCILCPKLCSSIQNWTLMHFQSHQVKYTDCGFVL
jgi:hypothetical protein